jgi:hypothetical protein
MARTYSKLTNGIESDFNRATLQIQAAAWSRRGSPTFGNSPIDFRPVIIVALDFTAAVAQGDVPPMGHRAEFLFGEVELIGREFSIVGEQRPRDW